MKASIVPALRLIFVVVLVLAASSVTYSKTTPPPSPDFTQLGINRGIYNAQAIQALIDKRIASRIQATASREVYKSYHIEILELPPRLKRAQTTFFGEVTSTFTPNLSGGWSLTEVELKSVALDQLGTPIGAKVRVLSARLTSGTWSSQVTLGVPIEQFPNELTDFNRKALFSLTGLLRHAPGQPAIVWTSDVGDELAQRLISSIAVAGFIAILPERLVIQIATELVSGIAADRFIGALLERSKAGEFRWGVAEEITDSLITDNPLLFETFGERVWTDPRGIQAGCSDLVGNWRKAAERVLAVHRACLVANRPIDSPTCHQSQARFALDVFGVADFYKSASPSEMTAEEILSFVESPTTQNWELIGEASDETVRRRAQEAANAGILVLAIRRGDSSATLLERKFTKVAFILPGTMTPSNQWGGLVPISATLAVGSDSTAATYVDQHLGFAFTNGIGVRLYTRKY